MQRTRQLTSAELVSMVEHAGRLAQAAGRADLVDRSLHARDRLTNRRMRVIALGAPGQGSSTLVHSMEQAARQRLPAASFAEVAGPADSKQIWLPEPGSADVTLFVSEANQEYSTWDLNVIERLRTLTGAVLGVMTKIDLHPRWADVQRANRHRLQAANLDSPPTPLLPVSAAYFRAGHQRADDDLMAASGIPQLLEFLGGQTDVPVEASVHDAVLADIRQITDQLTRTWNTELHRLSGTGLSPQQQQDRAIAELDRRQRLSAAWQTTLADGITELVSQVDFDLRERLRDVLEDAETDIKKSDPSRRWKRFDQSVRADVTDAVHANYTLTSASAQRLAERVAARLAGNRDGSPTGIAVPKIQVEHPESTMTLIKRMEKPENGGTFARLVNSLRGAYGGILMVGVFTSLAGQQLISPYSVAAGVLLGLFTFWEDRKNGRERGKAEATAAVAKLMDNVNFRIGDDQRAQLRAAHRAIRDHFTRINDQRLREAADDARAAVDAVQHGDHSTTQEAQIHTHLTELRQLQARAMAHQ